ncbi:MAG: BtaA family protein [Oscillospiraceae bacterium]|nr:BtaA family protein [Oscillospiraceae bacterium]
MRSEIKSEIENRAKFDLIRYSQVWEDADLLIEALDVKPHDVVLSIASAGDNAFALLAQNPKKVYAVDLSFAQIACCELRKAMYRELSHKEHLLFGGVISGAADRISVFNKLNLSPEIREYWEQSHNIELIKKGFMAQGKFEKYFGLFRKKALPLVHTRKRVANLLEPKSYEERKIFYDKVWDNFRWKMMFRVFFSRFVMGRLGRDKEFFKYVEGSVADKILSRSKHALSVLEPAQNPYMIYILNGEYTTVFPYSLREENYEKIRNNLEKIEFKKQSIEGFLENYNGIVNCYNLSDIFEYMSQESMEQLFTHMLSKSEKGTRFAYWNMLALRKSNNPRITTDDDKNRELLLKDKAFFYSAFELDEVK